MGLERTGHFETVAFRDNNQYSKLILDKHWKGVKIYDDVRESVRKNLEKTASSSQTSSQGASRVNRSRSRANKKERVTTDISGQRCFASSRHSNRGTLLARMCEGLLTSKKAWSSRLCALTWKVKDTKFNRSLFQLQASVLPIGEKEFGSLLPTPTTQEIEHPNMKLTKSGRRLTKDGKDSHSLNLADTVKLWATPNTMDYLPPRSEEGTRKLMEGQRKGRTGPSNLREQVDPKTMQLWRTPTTMPLSLIHI